MGIEPEILYFAGMVKKIARCLFPLLLFGSCYAPQRDCKAFANGTFSFTTTVDDKEVTTIFERQGDLEIDYFEGKVDSSSVRWINDCEYIVRKLHPKNKAEEQAVHMKILSTTNNSYTFEYNLVGDAKKSRGTAVKTD